MDNIECRTEQIRFISSLVKNTRKELRARSILSIDSGLDFRTLYIFGFEIKLHFDDAHVLLYRGMTIHGFELFEYANPEFPDNMYKVIEEMADKQIPRKS